MHYKNTYRKDLKKPHPQFVDCVACHAKCIVPIFVALHHFYIFTVFTRCTQFVLLHFHYTELSHKVVFRLNDSRVTTIKLHLVVLKHRSKHRNSINE